MLDSSKNPDEWYPIPDFDDYEVNGYGEVRNKKFDRIIRQHAQPNGFIKVNLYTKGMKYGLTTHRVVASIFLKDYQEGIQVEHKDLDRTNNVYDNLAMGNRRVRGLG